MSELPKFAPETQSPFQNDETTESIINDITRGGERLVQKVSNDVNRISILRAMQMGYLKACQDNGFPLPEFDDPAVTMGYGNV